MSWQIFKDNILRAANNPEGIQSIDQIAELYATEYDAAIKRGGDTLNHIAVLNGNLSTMKELFKIAFLQGQSSTMPYDLVGQLGNGVLAYWAGAELQKFPLPIQPAPGTIVNIAITQANCTIPGVWQPPVNAVGVPSLESIENEAINQDHIEFEENKQLYEEQFATEEEAMQNNSDVMPEEALANVEEFNQMQEEENAIEPPPQNPDALAGTSGTSGTAGPEVNKPKPTLVGRGDTALFKKCGNGEWPAKGQPGNFVVKRTELTKAKCSAPTRYWYETNEKYVVKNCTEIYFPTKSGDVKISVHKDLAAIVKPALAEIKSKGLHKYIENCEGGLAIRNVTCGTRLSNHAWGTAIDMNTELYPYGTKFGVDGVYQGSNKLRSFTDFDNGFSEVTKIFKKHGMTWLSNNDPMHVSIYE
jgi:hypothetical protein